VVADTIEDPEGVTLDHAPWGGPVSIEILDASRHVDESGANAL
jgi:hypothetical protein